MRNAFNDELIRIARGDPRIYMILADIGYGEVEPFRDAFPTRWYNCGVAEQAMTGIACGVAMEGNIAVTYSIANFPTLRPLEQIRNDVAFIVSEQEQKLNLLAANDRIIKYEFGLLRQILDFTIGLEPPMEIQEASKKK